MKGSTVTEFKDLFIQRKSGRKSLTNKETTAKTFKDFKRCLRKFDTDKINFEPILAITNNRDTDYKYF